MTDNSIGASAPQQYALSSDPVEAEQQLQKIAAKDPVIAELITQYGAEAVGRALSNSYVDGFVEQLKAEIDSNDDLSQAMKDEAKAKIDEAYGPIKGSVDPMLQDKMNASTLGQQANEAGGHEASELAKQADAEVAEGSGSAGGGMEAVGDEDEKNTKGGKGGGSWLVALAKGLAEIQSKFLNAAMENLAEMSANADGAADISSDDTSGLQASSQAFMTAQASFQANMKMFGMASEATSTTLKTIGEALMSLSRKQ